MATLDENGVELHKLNGRTYKATELIAAKVDYFYEIRLKIDDTVVETTTMPIAGVDMQE